MNARRRRWLITGALVAAADGGLLLAADAILRADVQVHTSAVQAVGQMLAAVASILPTGVVQGFGAIAGTFGASAWLARLLGPAVSQGVADPVPILGGMLAAPIYFVARRLPGTGPEDRVERHGAPPHRVYLPQLRQPEALAAPSIPV